MSEWTSSDVSTSYRLAARSHEAVTTCLPPTSQSAAITTPWWLRRVVVATRIEGQSFGPSISPSASSLSEKSTSSSQGVCCGQGGSDEGNQFPDNSDTQKQVLVLLLLTLISATGCGVGSWTMYLQMWAVWSPEAEDDREEAKTIRQAFLKNITFPDKLCETVLTTSCRCWGEFWHFKSWAHF